MNDSMHLLDCAAALVKWFRIARNHQQSRVREKTRDVTQDRSRLRGKTIRAEKDDIGLMDASRERRQVGAGIFNYVEIRFHFNPTSPQRPHPAPANNHDGLQRESRKRKRG